MRTKEEPVVPAKVGEEKRHFPEMTLLVIAAYNHDWPMTDDDLTSAAKGIKLGTLDVEFHEGGPGIAKDIVKNYTTYGNRSFSDSGSFGSGGIELNGSWFRAERIRQRSNPASNRCFKLTEPFLEICAVPGIGFERDYLVELLVTRSYEALNAIAVVSSAVD